jgi:membrane-bound metal-dependent hydrolase YbcI (DUF457 family)
MSWAAHEFEHYFLQKHVGVKASFFGLVVGASVPDLFTKKFVYAASNPAQFHRGWPGVGFTHSFIFGLFMAVAVLAITRSRNWAVGILVGQWAHVATDICDTAGVMPFFPFSTENFTISMWKHAAAAGRHGDAAAYYSSLGGVWDFFWFVMVIVFARNVLNADYFRRVVIPADVGVWSWFHRRLHLSANGMLIVYRTYFMYGFCRMTAWFLYARFDVKTPFQPIWGGPRYLPGNDLSDASVLEMCVRTLIGGVLFFAFVWLCWVTFVRKLWTRGYDPAVTHRGTGIHAVFH